MLPNPRIHVTARASSWRDARKILAVRLDSLGDVLMTTPAIRALKESVPGRHITLLTSRAGAEAAQLVPEIDQVIIYEPPWMKATAPRTSSRPEYAMVDRIRWGRFDGAVIFTVYSQNPLPAALLCYLAEIPRRAAFCRENPYQLLTDWVPETEPEEGIRHEVRRQLDLAAAIGSRASDEHLSLRVSAAARERAKKVLRRYGVDLTGRWMVIHPGASAPSRRYSPRSFGQVAQRLALEDGYQIVLTGTADESDLVQEIRNVTNAQTYSLAGDLKLEELASVISLAPLLISNNTGPVHIAAAVGTPVVDLYALTNPQHTPWMVPNRVLSHDVPCKYCYKSICPEGHHNCLRLVTPEEVIQAARDLLDEQAFGAHALPDLLRLKIPELTHKSGASVAINTGD